MKKVKNSLILFLLFVIACKTTDLEVVDLFIKDLNEKDISNLLLIDKYFEFDMNLGGQEKKEALDLVGRHLELLRQKINADCQELEVLKHDENKEFIAEYNLNYDGTGTVFYLVCDKEVIVPILIEKSKIRSITSYSKTEDGKKGILIF